MKVYKVEYKQLIKASIQEVWDFFSAPANLSKITPPQMNFKIIDMQGDKMFAGQIIRYRVTVLPLVRVGWTTEITEVENGLTFVDEQRKGPYRLWRHRHTFRETAGGVEMTDVVEYAIPFGLMGRLANFLFVAREVKRIFAHRFEVVEKLFNKNL
jgi:ligand-binding SRPBCC domain-containing protein